MLEVLNKFKLNEKHFVWHFSLWICLKRREFEFAACNQDELCKKSAARNGMRKTTKSLRTMKQVRQIDLHKSVALLNQSRYLNLSKEIARRIKNHPLKRQFNSKWNYFLLPWHCYIKTNKMSYCNNKWIK